MFTWGNLNCYFLLVIDFWARKYDLHTYLKFPLIEDNVTYLNNFGFQNLNRIIKEPYNS